MSSLTKPSEVSSFTFLVGVLGPKFRPFLHLGMTGMPTRWHEAISLAVGYVTEKKKCKNPPHCIVGVKGKALFWPGTYFDPWPWPCTHTLFLSLTHTHTHCKCCSGHKHAKMVDVNARTHTLTHACATFFQYNSSTVWRAVIVFCVQLWRRTAMQRSIRRVRVHAHSHRHAHVHAGAYKAASW